MSPRQIASHDAQINPMTSAMSGHERGIYYLVDRAVRQKSALLAFQPVVGSDNTGRATFYEGLIRILDEEDNVLPAGEFMPLAETHEVGRQIDCLALEMGLQALLDEPALRLSINMSARSITHMRWRQVLRDGLAMDDTIAERLILEITESSAMVMPERVAGFMAETRRAGVCFALDDFGAGFTAFRYFKEFHFDILKIDGQFIRDIHLDSSNQVLAAAMLSIGTHFDMLTVAERVETAEDAECLAQMGVDCLQGYFFAAPTVHPEWLKSPNGRGR